MPKNPLGEWVDHLISWLLTTMPWLFDGISSVVGTVVDGLTTALTVPPFPVWIAVFAVVAWFARGWRLAAFTVAAFLLVVSSRLWDQMMQTLAVVIVAAVVATVTSVPTGIWTARSPAARSVLRPLLDAMQTMPVFVYLIPAVFFFGVGTVPGVVATAVFAVPPGVRLTELGIRGVDPEVVEASRSCGATSLQVLRTVQLPLAFPSVMAGINQIIMMSLSMVVVAGVSGAAGLGAVVVSAVTQLDVAAGFDGGLAVVVLAVFLDRVTGAVAVRRSRALDLAAG